MKSCKVLLNQNSIEIIVRIVQKYSSNMHNPYIITVL